MEGLTIRVEKIGAHAGDEASLIFFDFILFIYFLFCFYSCCAVPAAISCWLDVSGTTETLMVVMVSGMGSVSGKFTHLVSAVSVLEAGKVDVKVDANWRRVDQTPLAALLGCLRF